MGHVLDGLLMLDALLHRKISLVSEYTITDLSNLIIPVFKDKRDTGHSDADENDDEDTANVLN